VRLHYRDRNLAVTQDIGAQILRGPAANSLCTSTDRDLSAVNREGPVAAAAVAARQSSALATSGPNHLPVFSMLIMLVT
jgi:hypothetical protein